MANKTDAFFSGFMPTNATNRAQKGVLTYTIHVKDTKPVWFYCSQAKHCQAGMVGAINAYVTFLFPSFTLSVVVKFLTHHQSSIRQQNHGSFHRARGPRARELESWTGRGLGNEYAD
jgi:hypothetical protein